MKDDDDDDDEMALLFLFLGLVVSLLLHSLLQVGEISAIVVGDVGVGIMSAPAIVVVAAVVAVMVLLLLSSLLSILIISVSNMSVSSIIPHVRQNDGNEDLDNPFASIMLWFSSSSWDLRLLAEA